MGHNQVFVLAAEMVRQGEEWTFLPQDRYGFLHGEVRIEAANILSRQGMVEELIVVGGPTKDGVSKVDLMAKLIEGKVTRLESIASTGGNIGAIKRHVRGENNGILTQFYHLTRTWKLLAENGLLLVPICAEAVLLADNPDRVEEIRRWYSDKSMVHRIIMEISGLSDLEAGRYR